MPVAFTDRFKVKMRILDEDYVLISPAAPAHLERLAHLVDQKMRELIAREPRLSVTRSAVMTAMTFADQALNQDTACRELQAELDRQSGEIARLQQELSRANAGSQPQNNRKGRR